MMKQSKDPEAIPMLPLGKLDEIAIESGTDKSSLKHDYLRFYEYLLKPYEKKTFTLLELGVGIPRRKAPSLRTWKSYFPKAQIVGLDIRKVSKDFEEDRIAIEIGDASDPGFLKRVFRAWNPAVIIDDASHFWSHQIIGFKTLFPRLPANGIYIVEDIHTSFLPENSDYADNEESFWSFISRLQSGLACAQHLGPELSAEEARLVSDIDAIFLSRKTIAIIKRSEPRMKERRIARRKQ